MFNLCAFCINFQQLHQAFHSGVGLEGKIAFKAPVATRSSRRERCLWRKCWLQGIAVVIWDLIYTKKILKAGLFINSWRFRHFGKHERCHEHFGREGNGVLMPDLYEPIFTFIMDVWGTCIPSFYISGWCMPCMYKSGWWFSRIAWKYNYIYITLIFKQYWGLNCSLHTTIDLLKSCSVGLTCINDIYIYIHN